MCNLLEVVETSHDKVLAAIDNADFKDFEDCIQTKCARSAKADYIITRNLDDFKLSEFSVLTPQELIENTKDPLPIRSCTIKQNLPAQSGRFILYHMALFRHLLTYAALPVSSARDKIHRGCRPR